VVLTFSEISTLLGVVLINLTALELVLFDILDHQPHRYRELARQSSLAEIPHLRPTTLAKENFSSTQELG
jgi:hypothetical protein